MTVQDPEQDPEQNPQLPHQPHPPYNGRVPGRPPRKIKRGWKAYVVLALLIGIPLGYLYHSAVLSRESGKDKAETASAIGLTAEWPSKLQRRIYAVQMPTGAKGVAHFETNSLHRSSLYVEFTTSAEKLTNFLRNSGADPAEREKGYVPITPKQAKTVGWTFDDGAWSGMLIKRSGAAPDVAVAVDTDDPENPEVRVVSTTHI